MDGTSFGILARLFEQNARLEKERPFMEQDKYEEILKAKKAVFWRGLFLVLFIIIPIVLLFSMVALRHPITNMVKKEVEPAGMASMQVARVDYDGDFWWLQDTVEYEYPLTSYGLDPSDFKYGDHVYVCLDENMGVLAVSTENKVGTVQAWEQGVSLSCAFIAPLLIPVIFYVVARRGFGKAWYDFIAC